MGIIQQVQQPPQPQDQPENPTDQPDQQMPGDVPGQEPQGQGNSQQNYSKLVLAGIKVIHDPQTSQAIVQRLQSEADTPDKALADVTVMIMRTLKEKAPTPIPEEIVLPAAGEILGEVATVAQSAGIFEVTDDVEKSAAQLMVTGVCKAWGVSQQDMQQFLQNMDMNKVRSAVGGQQPQAPQQPQQAAPQEQQPQGA